MTLFDVLTKRATGGADLPGQATDAELLAWAETLTWDDPSDLFELDPPIDAAVEPPATTPPPAAAPAKTQAQAQQATAAPPRRRTLRARPLVARPVDRLD